MTTSSNRPVPLSATGAPGSIGFYSPAVRAGDFIFTAGQLPVNPETGGFVRGSVEEQTDRILRNIQNLLERNDSGLEYVVKSTIFLRHVSMWDAVNAVYARYFEGTTPPARGVYCGLDINYGLDVEIEVIAMVKK